uniref:Uncharacterized protein n=1 Tax=Rhipicephalus microplus TaxID=6941 RepID=A0A6M2DC42_RHIMP
MYFKRVGWRFLIPALITCILAFGSEYGSAVWLSKWSQDQDVSRRHLYITGYATKAFLHHWLCTVFGILRGLQLCVLVYICCWNAASSHLVSPAAVERHHALTALIF